MTFVDDPKGMSESIGGYQLWLEDAPPVGELPCDHCELANQSKRLIWGEGNPNSPVWILLDNPGLRERTSGASFVCGTRQTLQSVVHQVGFRDDQLYVTFVVRRRPLRAYDKPTERSRCIQNFQHQLAHAKPDYLMCLGDVAVQAVRQDNASSVKQFRQAPWKTGSTQVHATYHPLAVRRRPNLLDVFISDWRTLYTASSLFE